MNSIGADFRPLLLIVPEPNIGRDVGVTHDDFADGIEAVIDVIYWRAHYHCFARWIDAGIPIRECHHTKEVL